MGSELSLIQRIEQLVEAVRKTNSVLETNLRIPTLEVESAVDASGVTSISVAPNTSNIFLIRQVVCFIPAGASGLLVLGSVQTPVGPGTTSMRWYQALNPDDVRLLESTVSGTMALTLMGEQLSRRMMLR